MMKKIVAFVVALAIWPAFAQSITPQIGGGISRGFDGGISGQGSAAQTLWTPLNLGIVGTVWHDAADTSKFSFNTGKVASWTDSYSGTVASQATSGNQPAYSATGLNGAPGLVFTSASSQNLASNTLDMQAPVTVFAVGNYTNATTSPFIGSTVNGGLEFRGTTGGQYDVLQQNVGNLGTSTNSSIGGTNAFALFTYELTTVTFRVNGSVAGTNSTTQQFNHTGNLIIGGTNASEFFGGSMGDIISIPAVATLSQVQKIEGYEAWKFGLQGNLPGGHPYKLRAPLVSDP